MFLENSNEKIIDLNKQLFKSLAKINCFFGLIMYETSFLPILE